MPEQKQDEKPTAENIKGDKIEQSLEEVKELQAEAIPAPEIQEMREAVMEEIIAAEKPKQPLVKKIIPKKKKEEKPLEQVIAKSPTYKKIENIMEEGLEEVYLRMEPEQQKKFKEEGEKTVYKIEKLLAKAKVKIQEIIKLIREWLKLIPGVNNFFLEQEAKIKSDKILKIKK